jgi:hypothetical protein
MAITLPAVGAAETVSLRAGQDSYTVEERVIRGFTLEVENLGDEPIRIPAHHFPESGGLVLVYGGVEWRTSATLRPQPDRSEPLLPGQGTEWRFDDISFGYKTLPVGSHTDDPEQLQIEGLFEVRYTVGGSRSETQLARTAPFGVRCPRWWFETIAKSMVLESIGPRTDPALVEAEIDRLVAAVAAGNGDLPAVAARKLAILAPPRAAEPLAAQIDRHLAVDDVRSFDGQGIAAAVHALAAIGGPVAEQAVLDALVRSQAMDFAWVEVRTVRLAAMRACGELRVGPSLPVLLEIAAVEGEGDLLETVGDQKLAAVRAIGQLGDPAACTFLIGLCDHARFRTHHVWEKLLLESAVALQRIGTAEATAYLEQLAVGLQERGGHERRYGLLMDALEPLTSTRTLYR